ncbi:imidazole glycerol phosphate synthase subunit HisH [Rhodovibrionaceae bacterium A322]
MTCVIIDYGSGNLRSAHKALERAAAERGLSCPVSLVSKAEDLRAADRIVLPGVGAFADCKKGLQSLPGMWEALEEEVVQRGKPILGICVGMQLMASRGLEHGEHDGFGWIPGDVVDLEPQDKQLKIPHMGWNNLSFPTDRTHPVLEGVAAGSHCYFVHSYHLKADKPEMVLAQVDYGGAVTAAVGRDNLFATQFHPEKSQAAGLTLLGNFLEWTP